MDLNRFTEKAQQALAGSQKLAARMNQQHWGEGPEARRRYVTAIFLRLDARLHRLEVVNAGHNPGFLVHRDGSTQSIDASGAPLGILPGMSYTSESFHFPEGSRLLFYTDGITEVFREDDEEFGPERLLEHFRNCREREGPAMLDSVWTALAGFAGVIQQQDDMTALALHHIASQEVS